jgi:hypothetical protein
VADLCVRDSKTCTWRGHLLNECKVRLPEVNAGAAQQAAAEDGFDLLCVAGRDLHIGILLPVPRLETTRQLAGRDTV